MHTQILQADLAKGLSLVSRVTASRGQLPILSNVLLVASKSGLQLAATNLEIGLRINAGGKVLEEGSTTIPAKSLTEFVTTLGQGTVELQTDGDKLQVKTPKSTATFSGIPATEFPALPAVAGAEEGQILTSQQIGQIAHQVAFAAAADESRPVLTGVQFKMFNDNLVVVATDGFRMSQLKVQNSKFKTQNSLILPSRTILELERLTQSTGDKEIKLQFLETGNQVIFSLSDIDVISRVLEGNFPDITKIIPTDSSTIVTFDREELLQAVRTTSIFARENNNIINFRIESAGVKISAVAASMGENSTEVEAEVEGEGGVIAFNCKFVLDFINSVSVERVILKILNSTSPGVWLAEKDASLVHLIMPVRVQS